MKSTTYGKVLNRERHNQCLDFSGIAIGKLTPTDLDAALDYHQRAWVFIEVKYKGEPIPQGQRIAFDELIKDESEKKPVLFIICDHYIEAPEQDVDVATCSVREWSAGGRWIKQKDPLTVKDLMDRFLTIIDEPPTEEEVE